MTLKATSIFNQAYPKILTCKKSLLHSLIVEIQPVLESCNKNNHMRFLTTANAQIYQSTCDFHEFVSTCRKSGYFIISFQRYSSFEILRSDWSKVFRSIIHKLDFCQLWNLCRNTAAVKNF